MRVTVSRVGTYDSSQYGARMDPEDDAVELAWMRVFKAWSDGSKAEMAEWIRGLESPLPEDAREFLADLILGKVTSRPGRRSMRTPAAERQIVAMVYVARERAEVMGRNSRPADVALEEVAVKLNKSVGTVRGIVEKHVAVGIEFEAWKKWGRPKF